MAALQDMLNGASTDRPNLTDDPTSVTADTSSAPTQSDQNKDQRKSDPGNLQSLIKQIAVQAMVNPHIEREQKKQEESLNPIKAATGAMMSDNPDVAQAGAQELAKLTKTKPEHQQTIMSILGMIGKLAGSTALGAVTLGKYPEEQLKRQEEERQQQFALGREREQSRLTGEREAGIERQREAFQISPELRQAKIQEYRQQLEAQGNVNRIEQGRIINDRLNRIDSTMKQNPGMSFENAERHVLNIESGQYRPETTQKGQIKISPDDPNNPEGTYHYEEMMPDGTNVNRGPAPRPTSAKPPVPVAGRDVPLSSDVEAQRIRIARASAAARAAAAGSVSDNDIKDVAAGIIEGTLPPDLSGFYRNKPKIEAQLKRQGFDLTQATADWKAIQRYLTTLNSTQQVRLRQAIAFTNDTLPQIEDAYAEWKKQARVSGSKLFNRATMISMENMPGAAGSAATQLDALIGDFTSELGTVYKGGNASTDESLRLAATNLRGDWNEQTFNDAVARLRRTLSIRQNSINMAGAAGISPDTKYKKEVEPTPPKAPTPTATPGATGGDLKSKSVDELFQMLNQ